MQTPLIVFLVLVAALVCSGAPAQAYVGPGAGLSAIGSFLALVVAVLAAIVGFLWYPIKRIFGKRKNDTSDKEG